jgi:hypothetical protein
MAAATSLLPWDPSSKAVLGMKYSSGNVNGFLSSSNEEDDSDDLDDEENVKMEEELQIIDRDNAKLDFKKVFWYWRNYNVDWQSIYGNKILDEPDLIHDLIALILVCFIRN